MIKVLDKYSININKIQKIVYKFFIIFINTNIYKKKII